MAAAGVGNGKPSGGGRKPPKPPNDNSNSGVGVSLGGKGNGPHPVTVLLAVIAIFISVPASAYASMLIYNIIVGPICGKEDFDKAEQDMIKLAADSKLGNGDGDSGATVNFWKVAERGTISQLITSGRKKKTNSEQVEIDKRKKYFAILPKLRKVDEFSLIRVPLDDADFQVISRSTNLKQVFLDDCGLTDEVMRDFKLPDSVEVLDVSRNHKLTTLPILSKDNKLVGLYADVQVEFSAKTLAQIDTIVKNKGLKYYKKSRW